MFVDIHPISYSFSSINLQMIMLSLLLCMACEIAITACNNTDIGLCALELVVVLFFSNVRTQTGAYR